MEGQGTGGYDLPKRVGALEVTVDQLHTDQVETKRMLADQGVSLASLQSTTNANSQLLRDVAEKLDAARTKKPEWGVFASWAAVLLTIGALAFVPINKRVENVETAASQTSAVMLERAEIIGAFSSDMQRVFDELEEVRHIQHGMQQNRFTKQDGQRLEDKVDRLHK